MKVTKSILKEIPRNTLFQSILVFIFSIPLIVTIGQFISTGFIMQNTPVSIIFWPGVQEKIDVTMPVWLSFGIMAISYVVGIVYMFKKKTFGKVFVLGVLGLILAQLMGAMVNNITGLKELQQVSSILSKAGIVNKLIFSEWHNPVWEEIVFRGIPLIILVAFRKKLSAQKYKIAVLMYFIIPSVFMVLYHIPNHGMSRIVDTLILCFVFAWLALKYSFFAPLVLHYIFDAVIVLNISNMKGIHKEEVNWLSNNFGLINTAFSVGIIALLISVLVIFVWNMRKIKKSKKDFISI